MVFSKWTYPHCAEVCTQYELRLDMVLSGLSLSVRMACPLASKQAEAQCLGRSMWLHVAAASDPVDAGAQVVFSRTLSTADRRELHISPNALGVTGSVAGCIPLILRCPTMYL